MFKNLLLFPLLLSSFSTLVNAKIIECDSVTKSFNSIGRIWCCEVQNDLKITSIDDRIIIQVKGLSKTWSKIAIKSLDIQNDEVRFFPRNLDTFLPNLERIAISSSGLLEIHQSDLEPFTGLRILNLDNNGIKFIETDLFKFNPKLELISLEHNKIMKISPSVFEHLVKLKWLMLQGNDCIDFSSGKSEVIKKVKIQCSTPEERLNELVPLVGDFDEVRHKYERKILISSLVFPLIVLFLIVSVGTYYLHIKFKESRNIFKINENILKINAKRQKCLRKEKSDERVSEENEHFYEVPLENKNQTLNHEYTTLDPPIYEDLNEYDKLQHE